VDGGSLIPFTTMMLMAQAVASQPAIEKLPERNRHARFTQIILSRNKLERESNSNYSAALTVRPLDKRRP
jgi:hypothetical protein